MFANRFTIVVDACVLVRVLPRNIILSLAEAGLFRPRWSETILEEMERALRDKIYKGRDDAADLAAAQRTRITEAFDEALVHDYDACLPMDIKLPDGNDRHVIAAAIKVGASVIVTDNVKDFPTAVLAPLDIEVKTADDFIADTLDLPEGHREAVAAIRKMRERLKRPEITAKELLLRMEGNGLLDSANVLRDHVDML